jgi:hypothetical protein
MSNDKQIRGLMIFEWVLKAGRWKSSYGSMEKEKKKRIGVPVTRSYFYLFLSHRHAVLSRGTQQNRRKLSECSNLLQISWFSIVSAWSDISDQVGHFHRVPEAWQLCHIGHIWPLTSGQIYLTRWIYLTTIGFQNCGNCLGQTYPTSRIYLVVVGF